MSDDYIEFSPQIQLTQHFNLGPDRDGEPAISVTETGVQFNLDAMAQSIGRRALTRARNVAFGLQAARTMRKEAYKTLRESSDGIALPDELLPPFDQARSEFEVATLSAGLSGVVEDIHAFLVEVGTAHALSVDFGKAGGITAATLPAAVQRMEQSRKKLEPAGAPEKLERLAKGDLGLKLPPTAETFLAANALRNCLAHRAGVVGRKNVGADGFFRVPYEQKVALAQDSRDGKFKESGYKVRMRRVGQVQLPFRIEVRPRELRFAEGAIVRVSPREFTDLVTTLLRFCEQMIDALADASEAAGATVISPRSATPGIPPG